MVFIAPTALLCSLLAASALLVSAANDDRLIRRALHKYAASSTSSASSAQWTTINGKQYPTDLGPDAPAPVIQDSWWLDEVSQNDTKLHKFKYSNLPNTSEDGQKGTNICKKGQSSPDSMCQTVLINSGEDFCLWAPPQPNTEVSVSEEYEVAWCTQDHGARFIPEGTLSSVHFIKTDAYVQVTGTGDFTKINIAAGDEGGELDPHGATGSGNPAGGLVYTTAFSSKGKHEQVYEWMSEISATDFCFRACKGYNATSQMLCSHIYDEMGCGFIIPTPPSSQGVFESCDGDVALPPGIISTYTFTQGDPVTPLPRNPASSSNCHTFSSPAPPTSAFSASSTSTSASNSDSLSKAGATTANTASSSQTIAPTADGSSPSSPSSSSPMSSASRKKAFETLFTASFLALAIGAVTIV